MDGSMGMEELEMGGNVPGAVEGERATGRGRGRERELGVVIFGSSL